MRKDYWGYASNESLTGEQLIAEQYKGICPAPGYPACPDHTAKGQIFKVLDTEKATGMTLTESYAMNPAAAVSGFYLAHPESHYFAVNKIGPDQLRDWAERSGHTMEEAKYWLAPLL